MCELWSNRTLYDEASIITTMYADGFTIFNCMFALTFVRLNPRVFHDYVASRKARRQNIQQIPSVLDNNSNEA